MTVGSSSTPTDALAPRDLNHRQDAYEWNGESPELISTGVSPFDSSLLSASADGTDAFFFTRDSLVPQDENGTLAKVYDAREEGGFPFPPRPGSLQGLGRVSRGRQSPRQGRCRSGRSPATAETPKKPRSAVRGSSAAVTAASRRRPRSASSTARGEVTDDESAPSESPVPSPLIAMLAAILAAPASAEESIESFSSTLSTTLVGGHPDIETSFRLAEPGRRGGGAERRLRSAGGDLRQPEGDRSSAPPSTSR